MLDFLWSLGGFIVAIGVLVAFHEYGHYWVARRCGVKVLRFSIGFGKPIWTRRDREGVEWTISAIPLGGYVKMLDEREAPVAPDQRALAFNNATVGKRMAIVAAGPAFNFGLAILLYWGVYVVGVQGLRPLLAEPPAGSAAAAAGLVQGDEVLAVAGRSVPQWTQLRTELLDHAMNRGQLPLSVRTTDGSAREVQLDLSRVRMDPEFLFDDLGLMPYQPPVPAKLDQVVPGEAADAAGFRAGDLLLSYNGVAIDSWQHWATWLRAHPGEVVRVEVDRNGQRLALDAIIGQVRDGERMIGRFGAAVAHPGDLWQDLRAVNRLGPFEAVPEAVSQTWRMSSLTVRMLGRMITGDVSVKNVSGPIQIAQVAGFSAQIGLVSFLSFMAIVSVSLGVLNLLPVPVLDGGHLLYYAVEAVKGSPVSERVQEAGQRIGLTLLVMLMGLAFYNDIARLLN
ncbi:MAG TPA: sigma E protease regulator RseP [Solimonas sp.]